MKTFRDAFEENYMAYEEPCNNKRGFRIRYEYIGAWYVYKLEKEEKQRYKRILAALCILSTVFFAMAALQKCELNYSPYPTLFSGLSLALFLFEWLGVIKFVFSGERSTSQAFDEQNTILRIVPCVNAVLLACTAASCVALMVRNGLHTGVITVPLFYFLSGAGSFLITFFYRALPYEKQENKVWDDGSKKFINLRDREA